VLTRCLQSDDDRVAMMAAQAILDRGYGKPVQQVDANINEGSVRYVEVPRKAESAEAWLQQQVPALANAEPAKDKVNQDTVRLQGQTLGANAIFR
jgi:hypothetical protein